MAERTIGRRRTTPPAETDKPRVRRTREADESTAAIMVKSGWDGHDSIKSPNSYADNLKVTGEAVIIRFLDEGPFAAWLQHWIERSGKKSFPCIGDACPLCDQLDDRPSKQAAFNVISLEDPDDPKVLVWQVGPMVANIIKKFAEDKKTSPINKHGLYWAVSKNVVNTKTTYSVLPVKERDLVDDWEMAGLTEDEVADLAKDATDAASFVHIASKDDMQEVADADVSG